MARVLRKEVALGFSLITVLLLVLGTLVYRRAMAMWQTPDSDAMAASVPAKPIVPIDGRPRIVVAQDMPPADQPLDEDRRDADAESTLTDQPYAAPGARQERLHSSFLPRQFEQTVGDPANPANSPGDEPIGDRDPTDVDSGTGHAPADANSSGIEPSGRAADVARRRRHRSRRAECLLEDVRCPGRRHRTVRRSGRHDGGSER